MCSCSEPLLLHDSPRIKLSVCLRRRYPVFDGSQSLSVHRLTRRPTAARLVYCNCVCQSLAVHGRRSLAWMEKVFLDELWLCSLERKRLKRTNQELEEGRTSDQPQEPRQSHVSAGLCSAFICVCVWRTRRVFRMCSICGEKPRRGRVLATPKQTKHSQLPWQRKITIWHTYYYIQKTKVLFIEVYDK